MGALGFRLDRDEAWAAIGNAHTGIYTTLRRDGQPVALPVWHVVRDERIYVRTPRRAQKVARVRHDPRGSFMVESGDAWAELRAVVLPVRATFVDGDEATSATDAIDEKYAAYVLPDEQLPAPVRAVYDDMVVLRLEPAGRFLSWNNAALVGRG